MRVLLRKFQKLPLKENINSKFPNFWKFKLNICFLIFLKLSLYKETH
jgi:hypothetical protein